MHPTKSSPAFGASNPADSSYDIIGFDVESTDEGNFTESMSESLGSLDFQRLDDVVSLTGTEEAYEEDEVLDTTASQFIEPVRIEMVQSVETAVPDHPDSEVEGDIGGSQASLAYTEESLDTPSVNTPEGSRIFMKPSAWQRWTGGLVDWLELPGQWQGRVRSQFMEFMSMVLPGLLFATAAAFIIHNVFTPTDLASTSPIEVVAPVITTTIQVTTTATTTTALSTGVGLIPISHSSESISRSKKATVSFAPQGKHNVLVHVRDSVKNAWDARNCVTIIAKRDGSAFDVSLESVEDGILVNFPRREAYGVATLTLTATCRPKTTKEVKVHFGRGIMVEAFEKGKQLAQDVSGAAQEAERRLLGAKRCLVDAFDGSYGSWLRSVQMQGAVIREQLQQSEAATRGQASEAMDRASVAADKIFKDIKTKFTVARRGAQLNLLDAQLRSKVWWLKFLGEDEEQENYGRKAARYLDEQFDAIAEANRALFEGDITWRPDAWFDRIRKSKCSGKSKTFWSSLCK